MALKLPLYTWKLRISMFNRSDFFSLKAKTKKLSQLEHRVQRYTTKSEQNDKNKDTEKSITKGT